MIIQNEMVSGSEEFVSKYALISSERKRLQDQGELPSWIITPGYQMLKDKYLLPGETLRERYKAITECAVKYLPENLREDYSKRFFDLMWSGKLSLSTPILANMGRDKGCPVSCASSDIGDSIYDFYNSQLEAAMLSKNGFGTSSYMGGIRPRGSKITGSKEVASGLLPVYKDFVQLASDVSQLSRRGAWAGYIPVDHPDFYEVYNYIHKHPDGANVGWCITSEFITKLNNGDLDTVKKYQDILYLRMVSGKGYLWFPDKVNEQLPEWYKDKGLVNKGSNLCVAPETLILTKEGYIPIAELEGEDIKVWNGWHFSKTKVVKTGVASKVIRVTLDTGESLDCTPYHKFYVAIGYTGKYREVRAIDLQEGDKLIKYDLPDAIEGSLTLEHAYENGFYSGDGSYCKSSGSARIDLYHSKRELKPFFFGGDKVWNDNEDVNRSQIFVKKGILKDKFFAPTVEYTIESRLEWLAGYLDADGTVLYSEGDGSALIQVGSVEPEFLRQIQLMLQELGVRSKVMFARKEGQYAMPDNKGLGELKLYNCKHSERLLISCGETLKLKNLGLNTHRLILTDFVPQRDASRFSKVVSVVDNNRYCDTYCFNEPVRHMGMFNGILTGNCAETVPVLQENETYSCILSSVNCAYSANWIKENTVFDSIVFLHCVALNFLDIGKDIKGLEKVVEYTKNHMSLGLGLIGFHSHLQALKLPFEGVPAHLENSRICKTLQSESIRASEYLVTIFGEAPITKGYGRANALLNAIAPNLSSALICGGISNGIEPIYKNVYIQNTAAGKVTRVNPLLLKIMIDKGINIDEESESIILNNGSVKDREWLTDFEKLLFKTAFEIDQEVIIRYANNRQKMIDQGQSINLFFSANESEEYIGRVHMQAINSKYVKGLYYVRSESGIKVERTCVACEG